MPYTARARAYFHAAAARGEKGMAKLAREADETAAKGEVLPPVHHDDDEEKHREPWKSLRGE